MSERRRPIGAELLEGGVHFRVWAPAHRKVSLVIEGRATEVEMTAEQGGYFSALVRNAAAGTRYRYRLDGDQNCFPDPASRFQPEGPHGPSVVVDPRAYAWRNDRWPGIELAGVVVSEIHIGTFTREGTFAAAIDKLPLLADVGINAVELMPVNEFAGQFGWGYDGVDLWAPMHVYGSPDDFRRFIDAAHGLGLAVILDVVYNHFGPDGCYVGQFTPAWFTKKYENEWGDAINFDGDGSAGVREFFEQNAAYWIDEFRLDGLRLDATQSMTDHSPVNIMASISRCAREAAGERNIIVVGENEPQDVRLLREFGLDALWNDDWHHAARVALTGRREAYYTDYLGRPQEFVSMAKRGFLFQGQQYQWQKKRRGTPAFGIAPKHFVCYLEDHDQIANSTRGLRLHELTSPGRMRAMTTLLLLGAHTPMLFQGQEFAASSPFVYFADHTGELAEKVASGRREFLTQFPSVAEAAGAGELPVPNDPQSFMSSKLDWSERDRNHEILDLHRDLLRMRHDDPVFSAQSEGMTDGAVLADEAFVLRWINGGDDRLLIVNLGADVHFDPAPEPLLAPPAGGAWKAILTTDDPKYGGGGTGPVETEENWRIPAHAAIVMRATSA